MREGFVVANSSSVVLLHTMKKMGPKPLLMLTGMAHVSAAAREKGRRLPFAAGCPLHIDVLTLLGFLTCDGPSFARAQSYSLDGLKVSASVFLRRSLTYIGNCQVMQTLGSI